MEFHLLMLSAMYENGGNTVHRFLDGHALMYVYPFESQLGTVLVQDHFSSMFPFKYRWPAFRLGATPHQDYKAIIDEECKVRARTPRVSKFKEIAFDFNDDERCEIFTKLVEKSPRSTGANVAAFFQSTFEAWKDYKRSGQERIFVGYSPIIVVDTNKIMADLPRARLLHVVRNPWSAYADTKKRPVPLSLEKYMTCWVVNQYHALVFRERYPHNVHIIRLEDVIDQPMKKLSEVCDWLGVESSSMLAQPTWNGNLLDEVYPWGTIRTASSEKNRATAEELSREEIEAIRIWAGSYLDIFNYGKMFF